MPKFFAIKMNPLSTGMKKYGKFAVFLTVLSWPFELGALIAKAYIYYNARLNRMQQEYKAEPHAMLNHVYDIKDLLNNKLTELSDVMTVNNPAWGMMTDYLSGEFGEKKGVVDAILWRFCEQKQWEMYNCNSLKDYIASL